MNDSNQKSLLVVDDVESNLDILLEILEDDFDVAVALDGESALKTAADEKPDLILLDIIMPGIDGYEVCRRLKADPDLRNIPVIFLSALTEEDEKQKGLQLGAEDYITKPFVAAEIQKTINKYLSDLSPGLSPKTRVEPFYNILLVDDIKTNIDILFETLVDEYDISVALDGLTAIKYAEEEGPDLILLDIMMPGMDGYEVCRHLKANYSTRNIPIIFITAMSEIEDESMGFEAGAVDFITKPISPSVVRARVRTHLALYDQNRVLEEKIRKRTKELLSTRLEIIRCLGRAAEYKDYTTGLHIVRMSYYSRLIGLQAGVNEEYADLLLNAAPMHDVGKIGIPDEILCKGGKLTGEEWEIMKTHTLIGAEILGQPTSDPLRLAKIIALSHHEKWNGEGYPYGLSGKDIPFEGRIVSLADVFDALTSERPYKKPWPVDEAVSFIRNKSGVLFDPELVEAFNQVLPLIMEIYHRYSDESESKSKP